MTRTDLRLSYPMHSEFLQTGLYDDPMLGIGFSMISAAADGRSLSSVVIASQSMGFHHQIWSVNYDRQSCPNLGFLAVPHSLQKRLNFQ